MATEDEAREAADGEEVQVEAVDLEPVHMQTHLDCKLSSMEIKNMGKIIDSTEGTLKIPEDQVLVEAPSEVKLPLEHNPNGTASSLNGHMDDEEKMSNEELHENSKKGQEQVDEALDEASTDQSNKISKEEVNGFLSHGESTTEDNSILKYEKEEEPKGDDQQDLEGVTIDDTTVQEDQLNTDNAVGKTVDGRQDQSLEPEKATEDTQPACMANIPDVEVVADASAGVQTPLEPNVDGSDAIPDVIDRNTEADEPANEDGVHLDQKSLPEDTSVAEHTDEAVKVEDQHSKQADAMDAEVVQEDKPKCEETDLQVEMTESEHSDESTIDAQEVLKQESSEETNGPVCEKIEETSQQSNVVASEETTSEHDAASRDPVVNVQVQNQESLEEKEDAEAVGTEAAMQQSSFALEEADTEDNVATTEPISDIEDAKDEGITNKSNVAFTEPAVQEPTSDIQPVHEPEQTGTKTKSTGTYEMDEASDQTHAVVGNLAQEDAIATASEPQVTEIAEEVKDIEATGTEEITQQDHIASSKELSTEDNSPANEPYNDDLQQTLEQDSVEVKDTETAETHHERNNSTTEEDMVEDNVTEEGPTCGSQEGDNVKSTEEIKENIAENIVSSVVSVDEADQEEKGPRTEDIAEKHMRMPEETKSTESVETEEASDQRHAAIFDDTPATEKQPMESAVEIQETEATTICENTPAEDHIIESETTSDTQEVNNTEASEAIKSDKDTKTGEISDRSNLCFAGESAQENNALESESTTDIQLAQEPEAEEIKNAGHVEENKTSHEMNAAVQKPTQEDNPTTSELHAMESVGEVSSIEATEAEATPQQSNADQSEEQTEENVTASETPILEPQSIEETNDIEATEPQSISQQSNISTSEKSLPEEIATEDNVTIEQNVGHQPLQNQKSVEFKETEANKPQGIASSSIVSTPEGYTMEDNVATTEQSSDTQAENLQSAEVIEDTENVKSNAALDEEAVLEEHVQTEAPVGISPMQDPELEETKNTEPVEAEDNMTSRDLPAEEMDKETMESEAIPHENPVASINVLIEDDILAASAPHGDIQPVLEQESVESMKCADTTEYPEEPQQITGSASNEVTPTEEKTMATEPACDTQVQNVTAQEIKDSEDRKTDEISNISSFSTPEEAAEKAEASSSPRIEPTSDVKHEQKLGSTEETRGIKAVEDHQQQRASTLEEVAIDSGSNVDHPKVHEDKPIEVKDTEAMETEEVFKPSNITSPANVAEERSELGSDPDQPAQQVELSRDSEGSQPLKAEESSGQSNVLTLEERNIEDSAADEIDPPVDIKQAHELESVEEIKGINATEAEEDFRTSQPDAPTEPIQQVNDIEATKEMKGIEAINDGDISFEQTETVTSEDTSPKDNETAPEDHHVESNEQNLGNEIVNAMLVHGIKDEIQASAEQKDDACDSGETAFTTQKSENKTDEDAVQTSGEDTLETSNNINQIKEQQNTGIEHNSSQMAEKQRGENITHVQDKDIRELLTERGTEEASQAVFENDTEVSQDVTDKDDTIKSDEQTSDDDNRQSGDVAPQPQTCESSVDDEAVQKVNLDEQEKEDEKIESQKEELQANEQKHEGKRDDVTTEQLVEPQNTENDTRNRTEDTDVFQAAQTEAVVTGILENEQALHTSEESTTIIMDTKVENIDGTDEGAEEENKPNNVSTLDADSKLDNKEQVITGKDDIMAKDPTDETIDEITNEELEPDLASSVQEISDPSPSNGQVLENDPIAVPQNVESGVHREDKECTNKVNDEVLAIEEPEKETIAEVEENKEMQNEDNAVHHDESQTQPEKDKTSQLRSNEPCNADTKMDDTTTRCPEIINDNTTIQPRETEEIGENKGFNSISFPPKEDNVEQDLSVHKVEDEKQTATEQNAVAVEAMQQVDSSNADANNDDQASTSKSLPEHETESADDVMQLETEDNALDMIHETVSNEKTETNNTEATETETTNEDFCDKAAGADRALSDESLKTFGTIENLDASSIVTALKEGNMNEKMEDHKLALPAHPTQDENTPEKGLCFEKTEREMSLSEKSVPTDPDNNQIPEEQNEEDKLEPENGDAKKEVESDLPVSHFLMNLILGKESSDANGNSEPEAERKQEETRDGNSCLNISKQEESLVSLKVDDKLTFEEEKNDVKCSEETQQVVKEPSHDLKLDTDGSLETDVELNKNTHGLEIPTHQEKSQDKISSELLSEEAAGLDTKMEARDIEISKIELDDRAIHAVCQENMEVRTQTENGSLKENLDDLTNTKASEEETLAEGQTGLLCESLPEDRSIDAESEQTHLLTEPGLTDATSLPREADSVQTPVCAKQDKTIESSNTGVTTTTATPEIQLESEEVNKIGEKQHATTATGEVAEEHVETPHENLQKSTTSEATSDEQAPQKAQITETVSDTEIALAHEKEISQGSSSKCMDEKENSNFSIKEVENFQTAAEIQADGPNMQINQDTQDEAAGNQTEMEPEKLGESSFQEHQETGAEQNSPEGNDEADQQFLGKIETVIKEEDVHETVKSHTQTAKMNSNEEHELFDSKIQERDFNAVSPKEVTEVEENFVGAKRPEFSTYEEQSPKADKSNMADEKTYDAKTKDEEETKNFTDEVKTEAPGAGQKAAHKKHNLLSGVGSKVKHQLAKVKKAIVGKPGHTKPESPKA